MKPTSHAFAENAHRALHDRTLQQALAKAGAGFSPGCSKTCTASLG